jgi:hypothetical protein
VNFHCIHNLPTYKIEYSLKPTEVNAEKTRYMATVPDQHAGKKINK